MNWFFLYCFKMRKILKRDDNNNVIIYCEVVGALGSCEVTHSGNGTSSLPRIKISSYYYFWDGIFKFLLFFSLQILFYFLVGMVKWTDP